LVEEAALRREVFISEQIGDFNKFTSVAGQYLRRFRNSTYADNFLGRFTASLVATANAGRLDHIIRLEGLLDDMDEPRRLRLYLVIARSALVNGKLDTAQYASGRALIFAPEGTAEAQRAVLYSSAVTVLTQPDQDSLAKLEGLDFSKLPRADISIAAAAIAFAKEIHHWPELSKGMRDKDGASLPTPTGLEQAIGSADTTIDLAQKSLSATDDVQKAKRP
jgi:chemotaxis protein MotC